MGLLLLLELVGVVEVMLVGVCLGSAFGASGRCSVAMLPQRVLASSCRVGVGGRCVVDSRAPTAAVVRHSNARARRGLATVMRRVSVVKQQDESGGGGGALSLLAAAGWLVLERGCDAKKHGSRPVQSTSRGEGSCLARGSWVWGAPADSSITSQVRLR